MEIFSRLFDFGEQRKTETLAEHLREINDHIVFLVIEILL